MNLVWVIGGRGLLGSHVRRALLHHIPNVRLWESTPSRLTWTDAKKLMTDFDAAVAAFADAVHRNADAWSVVWCAGKGVVTSPTGVLEPEWLAWKRLLNLLGDCFSGSNGEVSGSVFLASSAGTVYGRKVDHYVTEHTPTQPASNYGVHKLRMEDSLRDWSDAFPGHSCLIGRISSLYGPGQ